MSTQTEVEPYYLKRGQEVVDMLYDNKIINPELTRENMRVLEDYLGYMFQSDAQMSAKSAVMLEKLGKKQ